MGTERFLRLLIPGVDGDEGFSFHVIDNKAINVPFVIGGIGDKESPVLEPEKAFKFLYELHHVMSTWHDGNLRIGLVIRQRFTNKRNSLSGDNDMCAVAPEEEIIIFLSINFLVGIIA